MCCLSHKQLVMSASKQHMFFAPSAAFVACTIRNTCCLPIHRHIGDQVIFPTCKTPIVQETCVAFPTSNTSCLPYMQNVLSIPQVTFLAYLTSNMCANPKATSIAYPVTPQAICVVCSASSICCLAHKHHVLSAQARCVVCPTSNMFCFPIRQYVCLPHKQHVVCPSRKI
jgi:hypothetical protein